MAATRMCGVVFGFLLFAGVAQGLQDNPMDKVFQLMGELTAKIKKEGVAEDKAFKEFFEWCDDAAGETKNSLKTATSTKEKLTSTIEKASADSEAATTKIDELASSISTAEADLKGATEIRSKEAADFATVEAELVDGIDTLERAIGILSSHGASLLQKKVDSSNIKALLATLNVVISDAGIATADKSKLVAMVQSQHSDSDSDSDMDTELGAPAAASYEGHSGGILDILGDMKDKAEGELKDARKAESTAAHEYALLKKGLEDQLAAETKEMAEQKSALADAEETKATASGDLAEVEEELSTLNANLATTSTDCMTGAQDKEDSEKARAEELAVIAKAKSIIEESTKGATSRQYGFIQLSSRVSTTARAKLANAEVVAALKKLAKKQKSGALAQLASQVNAVARYGGSNAEDIFAKIKGLITDMIEKLMKEAAEEASKKAYCDEENAKNKAKKEDLTADIDKLTAKIDKAAAASAELKEDVATLQAELADLAKLTAEMDKARDDEKAAFDAEKADLEAGINGIQGALEVLREYYGSASASLIQNDKFDALMQQPAKPAGHSAASGAGGSIISILEVCESDFSKSLAAAEMKEASAASEYEKVTQENKITKATKDQDVKYKTKEFKGLDKSIAEWSSDKGALTTELDAVLEYQTKLDDQCIAKVASYEEIKAKREEEIAGLKDALKILETEAAFLQRPRHLRSVASH